MVVDIVDSSKELEDLRKHHKELKKYLEQWSLEQERLVTNVQSYAQQSAAEGWSDFNQADAEEKSCDHQFAEQLASTETEKSVELPPSSVDINGSSKLKPAATSSNLEEELVDDYEQLLSHNRMHERWEVARRNQSKIWEARQNGFLQRLIHNVAFESVGMVVILANACVMAVSVDYTMHHRIQKTNKTLETFEWILSAYYAMELILRLAAERWYFFFAPHADWNMFDLFLVCFSLYEVVMEVSQKQGGGGNMSFFRILRICKMLKMLRILRVLRSFRELRLIMASMLGSMRTMFWSVIMILVINFMIALFLMQNVAGYIVENAGDLQSEWESSIEMYWRSMTTAMISLYMSSTGGDSWRFVAEPLKAVGAPFHFCFMLYVAFFMFVIVNTMTSIFIEAAMVNAEKDQKAMIREEMKKKHEYVLMIKQIFSEMDRDGKGRITKEAFMANLHNSKLVAFLSRVGIDALDAESFFDILSTESEAVGSVGIDVEVFVLGCMKLRGAARSMDLLGLIHKHEVANSRLSKAISDCRSILGSMQKQLASYKRANEPEKRAASSLRGSTFGQFSDSSLNNATNETVGPRASL